MHLRRTGVRFATLVAAIAVLLALTATVALAAGPTHRLSVTELQTKLNENGGTLPGYLKTVLKGSDIVTLSVEVRAVTTGFGSGPVDMSSLILFESDDATITKLGGIAAGMSGSPIYVDDGTGTDKLIGALSYGDIFTTGGTGLATPIDAMVNMQEASAAAGAMRTLASPVIVDGQVKDRVMVLQGPDDIVSEPANTIVAKPLSAIFVGGLNPSSRMYKAYAKVLESKGIQVMTPLAGGLSSNVSPYSAEFEAGSAVAALAARGDLWAGGIGTVTYTEPVPANNTTTVVAFGHPAFWEGDSGLYLCNAWIDGVWPSTLTAYKLGRPAAVRGTLTQDRTAGILGVDGMKPVDVPISAKATRGSHVATSAVQLPQFVADSSTGTYFGLPAASAYVAGSRVFDAVTNRGSAVTTTTVVVKDKATGKTHTIVRPNVFSDGTDISMAVVSDVDRMVTSLQEANANGIARAELVSVDLQSTFSASRREAEIVDLYVAGGLKHGRNAVRISFLQYGQPATQTVDTVLNIPSNVPFTGNLSATAVNNGGDSAIPSELLFLEALMGPSPGMSSIDRRTTKNVVDELASEVDNTVVRVTFQPAVIVGGGDGETPPAPAEEYDPIETTTPTSWFVSGSVSKVAPQFSAYRTATTPLAYGRGTAVYGELLGVEGKGYITVTGAGATRTLRVTDGAVAFSTPALYRKTTLVLTFPGNASALPARTTLSISVKAKMTISASNKRPRHGKYVTLTARVLPKTGGGKVSFERWTGSRWVAMKTSNLPATGTLTYRYRPTKKGTVKIRAHLFGSAVSAASTSPYVTLRVK